jgi:hypothetical protein
MGQRWLKSTGYAQRSFRDSEGFAASRSARSSRREEIMYATRTTFAATTAVMAAKVESPRKQRVRRGRVVGGWHTKAHLSI